MEWDRIPIWGLGWAWNSANSLFLQLSVLSYWLFFPFILLLPSKPGTMVSMLQRALGCFWKWQPGVQFFSASLEQVVQLSWYHYETNFHSCQWQKVMASIVREIQIIMIAGHEISWIRCYRRQGSPHGNNTTFVLCNVGSLFLFDFKHFPYSK